MTNNVIQETFTLPSLGKCYHVEFNPDITLRSMTTNEEMLRLSPSDRQYKPLCDVIDACIIEKLPISSYDMILADYQFLIHKLRTVTYGNEYKSNSICPYCGNINEDVINLDEMLVIRWDDNVMLPLLEVELPVTKHTVRLRFQTPRMLDDIALELKSINSKTKQKSKIDNTLLLSLRRLIKDVDGEEINAIQLEKFLKDLPMRDTNKIIKRAEKLVERVGIDTQLYPVCKSCGLTYTSSFRTTSEFFGPEDDE